MFEDLLAVLLELIFEEMLTVETLAVLLCWLSVVLAAKAEAVLFLVRLAVSLPVPFPDALADKLAAVALPETRDEVLLATEAVLFNVLLAVELPVWFAAFATVTLELLFFYERVTFPLTFAFTVMFLVVLTIWVLFAVLVAFPVELVFWTTAETFWLTLRAAFDWFLEEFFDKFPVTLTLIFFETFFYARVAFALPFLDTFAEIFLEVLFFDVFAETFFDVLFPEIFLLTLDEAFFTAREALWT